MLLMLIVYFKKLINIMNSKTYKGETKFFRTCFNQTWITNRFWKKFCKIDNGIKVISYKKRKQIKYVVFMNTTYYKSYILMHMLVVTNQYKEIESCKIYLNLSKSKSI